VKFLEGLNSIKLNTKTRKKKSIEGGHLVRLININTYSAIQQNSPILLTDYNKTIFDSFQINIRLKKQAYYRSANNALFIKLISLNTKQGLKKKSMSTFSNVLAYIYQHFSVFDNAIYAENSAYITFYNFSKNFSDEFYKADFLIRYIYLYLELLFLIKRIKPKKKVKKKKIQQKTMVSYLSPKSRVNVTIRLINAYINSSIERSKTKRIGDALLYLSFYGKKSFLYKKKLSMYNKLLEKKKFY
jgi:hypothetical protein